MVEPVCITAILHSDQARNSEPEVFKEVCRKVGISKTRTTTILLPQSDGIIEQFIHTNIHSKFHTNLILIEKCIKFISSNHIE